LTKSSPVQGVIRIDTLDGTEQIWLGEKYEYAGEVIFVKKSDEGSAKAEDDGYLFTLLFNGKDKTSEFLIFDASNVSAGPISRLPISAKYQFQSLTPALISTNFPFGLLVGFRLAFMGHSLLGSHLLRKILQGSGRFPCFILIVTYCLDHPKTISIIGCSIH